MQSVLNKRALGMRSPRPTTVPVSRSVISRNASRVNKIVRHGIARDILAQPGIEGDPLSFLDVTDLYWKTLKNAKDEPEKKGPKVVSVLTGKKLDRPIDYDAVICGGTLGIFVAAALQMQGFKVAVVERRLLQGRKQEWNISRPEMQGMLDIGLITQAELDSCMVSEFNPIRVGFKGGEDMWVRDVLNCGISPIMLLQLVKAKFESSGGVVFENTAFKTAEVFDDGLNLKLLVGGGGAVALSDVNRPNGLGDGTPQVVKGPRQMTCRVMLDCMGHYSDLVKQIRGRAKPDGICMVVGSMAEGYLPENNTSADLLYSFTDAIDDVQFFWEAFPAEGGKGRTTYMFAYSDAQPERPDFEVLLDRYFELLPEYQGVPLDKLSFKRVLFGGFPCYSDGPLQPGWDRIMQIGDASATQSPLSFGGFGSMMRHLTRLSRGLGDALTRDRLSKSDLAMLHPYQPSLAASWLFQRSMSFGVGSVKRPFICAPAAANDAPILSMESMDELDDWVNQAFNAATPTGAPPTPVFEQPQPAAPKSQTPDFLLLAPEHVNQVLGTNFIVMKILGDRILRPFLQDTIQAIPLSLSMTGMMINNPIVISRVLFQVGGPTLGKWFIHYFSLIAYTILHNTLGPLARPFAKSNYDLARLLDALEYGSGSDHTYHPPESNSGGGGGKMIDAAQRAQLQSVEKIGEKAMAAVEVEEVKMTGSRAAPLPSGTFGVRPTQKLQA